MKTGSEGKRRKTTAQWADIELVSCIFVPVLSYLILPYRITTYSILYDHSLYHMLCILNCIISYRILYALTLPYLM